VWFVDQNDKYVWVDRTYVTSRRPFNMSKTFQHKLFSTGLRPWYARESCSELGRGGVLVANDWLYDLED